MRACLRNEVCGLRAAAVRARSAFRAIMLRQIPITAEKPELISITKSLQF